ncbi:MAG: DUF1080 domain-containing protein [Tepidisphaera sp.]|nr:DUF1080 domain-containing protein [Tepidisphaera sp.]
MLTPVMVMMVSASVTTFGGDEGLSQAARAAQGWKELSGADATQVWRGYKREAFPEKGWVVENGEIRHAAGGGGGDIVTRAEYTDFELEFDFKTGPKANSGVMYRVAEKGAEGQATDEPYMTGPEYQILEDASNGEKPEGVHSAGALYDIDGPPADKKLNPVNEWNHGRIYFRNGVVQHWLNGQKLVEQRMFDDDGKVDAAWAEKIAKSKFKDWKGFGIQTTGHIDLQEHPGDVAYRNVRVRDLAGQRPGEVMLFNGKDLTGWTAFTPKDKATQTPVWTVKDGILYCTGTPTGYLRTDKKYTNYVLRAEWRFNPVTKKPGNSGIMLRMGEPDQVWPKTIEAQIWSGNAGDFWLMNGFEMTTDPALAKGRNRKKTHMAEREVGEWNQYEIVVDHGNVTLFVNGEEVNHGTKAEEIPGYIGLQSEGAEIQFRNIGLVELK